MIGVWGALHAHLPYRYGAANVTKFDLSIFINFIDLRLSILFAIIVCRSSIPIIDCGLSIVDYGLSIVDYR